MVPELVTERQLNAMAEGNRHLVVLFSAEWSKPCRLFEPVLEQAAARAPEGAAFARLNVDDLPSMAEKHGIRSLPTLVYFRDGKPVRRSVGLQSPAGILEQLK